MGITTWHLPEFYIQNDHRQQMSDYVIAVMADGEVTNQSYLWLVCGPGRSSDAHNVFMILQLHLGLTQQMKSIHSEPDRQDCNDWRRSKDQIISLHLPRAAQHMRLVTSKYR